MNTVSGLPDYESMMPPEGFTLKLDGWTHAYTREQAKKGLQTWATSFNRATSGFEVWLVKPINDGEIHPRHELKIDPAAITPPGGHIFGIAQNITNKVDVASQAYVIFDAFPAVSGKIIKHRWTATPRRPGQNWLEYMKNNMAETLTAIRGSGIEERLPQAERPHLYYKLEQTTQKGDVAYTALETFNAAWGEEWDKFIAWSKLHHLKETVSLDIMLCPAVLHLDKHIAYRYAILYDDLEFLLSKLGNKKTNKRCQVIAAIREPGEADMDKVKDARFVFKGFDLLEDFSGISALTNCGGFDDAFLPDDLNEFGLVGGFADAYRIQKALRVHYPGENHANCAVWALWRMESL